MAEPCPWCEDCLEITRSQRECIHCGGPVQEQIVSLSGAPGGVGNAGEGPHHGWSCVTCHVLWDGGARRGFACPVHGGHEPETEEFKELRSGDAIGDYPGKH